MKQKTSTPEKFGLIVVSAPSGAGKSTLCTQLLKTHPDRVALSISSTSRAPRGQESHGNEYFFYTHEEFTTQLDQQKFVEWALVHGNYYGTSRETLENFWNQGRHVLLDIDVQGAESLRKEYPGRTFTVFIAPPSLEELERRLRNRGTENEEAIQKRMKNASEEMKRKGEFDLVLVNDVYDSAYQQLEEVVFKFMDQLEGGLWQKRP
jgi:guanylate kinase